LAFEVTVLGASGTHPTPGSACPGYLLRDGDQSVWLDAGTGTFANLQRHVDFRSINALVISHLHLDHILDLYPFYYALRYGLNAGPCNVQVYAPAGTEEHMRKLLTAQDPEADFGGVFSFRVMSDGSKETIGPFEFRFFRSIHPIETLAMRISADGRTLAYSADTGVGDGLVEFAKGADSLICEATMQEPDQELADIHLTAEQAAELAEMAGVKRLVLTHILPGRDPKVSLGQAARVFSGEIMLAGDNVTFPV
jgi:ribonuclease BN (tRNA processing enzyme)